jgi:hypothetical protein
VDIKMLDRAGLRALALEHADGDEAHADAVAALYDRATARGDGVAVFENWDLGHPALGHQQYVTYGSPQAQLELHDHTDVHTIPPKQLPDIGGRINWRYQLVAVARKGLLDANVVEVDPSEFSGGRVGNSVDHS